MTGVTGRDTFPATICHYNTDCYLNKYILFQMEYNPETDLPDYTRSHFLTFDSIELKKGDRVRIYTCKGEDHEEVGPRTGKRYEVVYWNLDAAVWKEHGSEVKLMKLCLRSVAKGI